MPSLDGERRQLTVLFCDLVDSTQLAAGLDAEDWREIVRRYQKASADVVERYGGHVAQYLGDGLLVYFGWPRAHEDDAERAVRAGIGIRTAVEGLAAAIEGEHGVRLAVRLGIHTGSVVVGEMGGAERRETLALGNTTNVAARLQELAGANAVVVSATTLRLIQGLFLTESLGAQALKGLPEPVVAYRVLQASGVRSRLDAAGGGMTPLVGREQELGLLLDRWEQVREGDGQAVLVSGETGIGKSRLVEAFREHLADGPPHTWLECRCSPYTQDSALYPVVDLLHQALAFTPKDGPPEKLRQLRNGLDWVGFPLQEVLPVMASFLSLPLPEGYEPPNLSAEGRKRRTLETLAEWLLRLGRVQPVILLFEDLQWVDPSTLELLEMILEQVPTAPLLAIYTHRPDFGPPWSARLHVTPMLLSRLTRRQSAEMIARVARGRVLPEAWVKEIVRRADGVPLFVEELTKAVLDSGALPADGAEAEPAEALAHLPIPETLQDPLMARLDQLGPAKELAQLCSCLGREFSYELLLALSPLDEPGLQDLLARAIRAELFYQRGSPPLATYLFRHALIQEVAYGSLLKASRQRYHRHIAETLEKRFPTTSEKQPEFLAHHFTEAGLHERAIEYWRRAGQHAIERSANVEAVRHLERGLAELEVLPEGPSRVGLELGLRTLLGVGLLATDGYGAERVERTFARARELCRELGDTPALFPVLFGLQLFHMVRAERKPARELVETLLEFAQKSGDEELLLEANLVAGVHCLWAGEHADSAAHLARAIELYDADRHRSHALVYGQDPGAYAHVMAGWNAWCMGFPDRARRLAESGLALAEQARHPFTLAGALYIAGQVRSHRREPEAVSELAERTLVVSRQNGFTFWEGGGLNLRGWALAQRGELADGVSQMREGFELYHGTGARSNCSYHLGNRAEAHLATGDFATGLATLEEALDLAAPSLDVYYVPELQHLKGALLLADGAGPEAAEACFRQALGLARERGARCLELRAATSLARLWRQQGRRAEARALLEPVYAWFTEGFDTADLKDAKTLLAELA